MEGKQIVIQKGYIDFGKGWVEDNIHGKLLAIGFDDDSNSFQIATYTDTKKIGQLVTALALKLEEEKS